MSDGGPTRAVRALLAGGPGARVERVELAAPNAGQVLVRVEWAALSDDDETVLRGGAAAPGAVPVRGHAVVGIVERCPGNELEPGERVVLDPVLACGQCGPCLLGRPCTTPRHLGREALGGFAEFVVADCAGALRCPPSLEPALASITHLVADALGALEQLARDTEPLITPYGSAGPLLQVLLERALGQGAVHVETDDAAGALLARSLGGRRAVSADISHGVTRVDPRAIGRDPGACSARAAEALALLAEDPLRFLPTVTDAVLLDEAPARLREPALAGVLVVSPGPPR